MPTYKERSQGIYRARYVGCDEKTLTDQETGEEQVRWLWRFQEVSDPATTGEIAKFTGTSLRSPNSNAYKMAVGIVGRPLQPNDDTEVNIGQLYDVVYGQNQAGNLTITNVIRVAEAPATPQEPASIPVASAPAPSDGTLPDLP